MGSPGAVDFGDSPKSGDSCDHFKYGEILVTTPTTMSAPSDFATAARMPRDLEMAASPRRDLCAHLKMYAAENPAEAALWCFGIGFILGWKLKPW